jgi:hypothetical protein
MVVVSLKLITPFEAMPVLMYSKIDEGPVMSV